MKKTVAWAWGLLLASVLDASARDVSVPVSYNPMRLIGIAGDCLFVSDVLAMTWVWHKDGLYVGRLFPDTGTGVMDATGIHVELMGNRIHEENGKLYTLVNDTGCAVHEVDPSGSTSRSPWRIKAATAASGRCTGPVSLKASSWTALAAPSFCPAPGAR